jgi:M6 family metalloprotease-like protein
MAKVMPRHFQPPDFSQGVDMTVHKPTLILSCVTCFLALPSLAQTPNKVPAAESTRPPQDFQSKYGASWRVRLSADSKRIESLVGLGTAPYGDTPEPAARRFLGENIGLFGLKADLADLRVRSQISGAFSHHVDFEQMANGLPVENARTRVNLSKDNKILEVKSSYAPFSPNSVTPRITKQQAIDVAVQDLLDHQTELPERRGTKKQPVNKSAFQMDGEPVIADVYFATERELRRAYKIRLKAKVPFGLREVVVDSETSRVLRSHSLISYFDGTGQVFIPNPVNSLNNNALTAANYSTQPNTSRNPNPYYTRSLLDLAPPVNGQYSLTGPFVTLEDIELPTNTPPTDAAGSFMYWRDNLNFNDVMVYYHIDSMQRYIQMLGFINVNNRRIHVDSDGMSAIDDSHYAPPFPSDGLGYIAFGRGGVGVAQDADMIAHKYGHSIQDNSNPGAYTKNIYATAEGEGFSDYWAVSTFSVETKVNGHDLACVGEWHATSKGTPCLRRVDEDLTMDDFLPKDKPNWGDLPDEHMNGRIWSRTLFDLFKTLGRTTTDRLALQSHFNTPSTGPSFKDAADAMVTADSQLFYSSHIPALCKEFVDRKIYKTGDCPTLPSATGSQRTLMVLVRFNDPNLASNPEVDVESLVNDMNAYLLENSFKQANLDSQVQGWFDLPKNRAYYYDESTGNPLVKLVDDVIQAMNGTVDFAAVDRMFILTNDDGSGGETRGQKDWATTGPWPFAISPSAGRKFFSASVHALTQSRAQFDHALGHHFGMVDLYPHDGVIFPRPYADGWSNMAKDHTKAFNNVHFLAWDKLKPAWLTDANVSFIPRPPPFDPNDPSDDSNDPKHRFEGWFPIYREETAAGNPVVIQIGTTPNVAQRLNERVSYYVEARKKAGPYDSSLPRDAVLVYYVNEDIGQGFGPLRLVDATPKTSQDLDDAGLLPFPAVSTALNDIDSTGLNVEVLSKVGAEDYQIHITYKPPAEQNDVYIHPHDSNWKSEDIWVDSRSCNAGRCGYDLENGWGEVDHGDVPTVGVENRLYARVYNHGPATAHNVRVDFYLSEPYHAIDGGGVDPDTGGNVAFTFQGFVIIDDLPKTEEGKPVFVTWKPKTPPSGNVHTCVKVKIQPVFNDTNPNNQVSQENLDSYAPTANSPYPPVNDDIKVVNPYSHPIFVYLRADDVPAGWTANIVPSKAYLPVGGSVNARMTIQAPLSYPVCSTEYIKATGWYAAGDTLVPLGASVAEVNLKKSTDLSVQTSYAACREHPVVTPALYMSTPTTAAATDQPCQELDTKGCTNPPRPYEHITLTYTGPDGNPIYHDVVTDKDGCYEDFVVNPQGGPWSVQTEYQGDVCNARTTGRPQVVVVAPAGDGLPLRRGGLWYSFHLGLNSPFGSFSKSYDPGPSLTVDAEYQIAKSFSLVAMYGLHVFDGNPDGLYYHSFLLDARVDVPLTWTRLYAQAGPGIYLPNAGSNVFGLNIGLGLTFPVLPKLKLEIGPDFHLLDPGGLRRWFLDAKLGVAFHL